MIPDEPDQTDEAQPVAAPVDATASYRLFQGGVGALVLAFAYFAYATGGDLGLIELLGLCVLGLAALPALLWAKNHRTWFPAFEISMLTCIAFYAVPLLTRQGELTLYSSQSIVQGGLITVLYLAAANVGFMFVRPPLRASQWATTSLLPRSASRYVHIGVLLNTVYIYVSTFTTIIPSNFDGSLRALCFGAGTIATFILARLWGLGELDQRQVGFFIANIFAQIVFLFSTLYLIGGISLLTLFLIAFASARRKIPWVVLLIAVPLLALLHLGKSEMRNIYWAPQARAITVFDLPGYYTEWFGRSLDAREKQKNNQTTSTSLFERASLIQMICLSVERVPEEKSYLLGESYIDIPAQIIPRFLWPDKPSSLLSNVRLALYFDLVSAENAMKVSIAFGMIAEAYINFGYVGVAMLGLLLGMGFKRISQLAEQASQFSALGIFIILLTAWSFQAEQVMATWLSSLFQACAISIGVPLAWKQFFGAD